MSGIKKWLFRTLFSCIKQRGISENGTRVEDILLPISPSNNPLVDVDTADHMKNEEEEEENHQSPSFRHLVIINKESQISDPGDEEFSFWPLPEESDPEDDEEYFECLQVQIDIANRWKQFSGKEEEESADDSESADDDEFNLLQKDIVQGRIKLDGRISTSRSILSCSSSQQQKKKVRSNLVEDCCPVSNRFRKAEIMFSKISRVLRFKNRSLKVVAPSWAHDNARISNRKAMLETLFVLEDMMQ